MTAWLLTWLWQGTALAGGVAVALQWTPRVNGATRHLIWCGVLVALAWLGWASSVSRGLTPVLSQGLPPVLTRGLTPVPVRGSDPIYVPSAPDLLVAIVLSIVAAAALLSLVRLLAGLRAVSALRDRCQPFPPTLEAQLPLWLEAKARGRRTRLMLCDAAPGATVLGFDRPCIAIPSSLVDALTVDELDQVILHEHAHVQRRDDWTRLAQMLLLSVLWVHPAAVFVSRAINREREMACDEWVVARTGLPKAYAACLARAAELRAGMPGGSMLLPTFVGRRHALVRRVDRVLDTRARARRGISFGAAAIAAAAIVLASGQLQRVRFAEMAEVVLPRVSAPMIDDGTKVVLAEVPVTPQVRTPIRRRPPIRATLPTPLTVRLKPDTTYEESSASDTPIAPRLSARTFPGAYDVSTFAPPLHIASADKPLAPNQWVEIGSTAKKTGLGIADAFSRAGVSLARRF